MSFGGNDWLALPRNYPWSRSYPQGRMRHNFIAQPQPERLLAVRLSAM